MFTKYKAEITSFSITFVTNLITFELPIVLNIYNGDISTSAFISLGAALLRTFVKSIIITIFAAFGINLSEKEKTGFAKIQSYKK